MTDANETANEGWAGEPEVPVVAYPEYPQDPHNHRFTISVGDRGPMIVARGNTAKEINEAFQELTDAETGPILAAFWSQLKAGMTVGQNLGPVTHVPQGQAPQQGAPTPPPMGMPQQAPQAPNQPYQGQPAWQQAGAQQSAPQGANVPAGWYKLNVPFKQKPAFDGIVQQYGLRKGDPFSGGQVSFQKAVKSWYCAPDVAGAFQQFSPVPA